jgi:type IV pilus assembly protein PilB
MPVTVYKRRIGSLLLERGAISSEQLDYALKLQAETGRRLGELLVTENMISENDLVEALSAKLKIPRLDLNDLLIDPGVLRLVPAEMARRLIVLPVARIGSSITLAMSDPLDIIAVDEVKYHTGMDINRAIALTSQIVNSVSQHYSVRDRMVEVLGEYESENVSDAQIMAAQSEGDEHTKAHEVPVVKLLNLIISKAVTEGASDIHFEPERDAFHIRFRVHGMMREAASPPAHMASAISSRLKIMADMDVSEKRIPQDGRFRQSIGGHEIDFRASSLPTTNGEKIVLRILDRRNLLRELDSVGMPPHVLSEFDIQLAKPEGLLLITGPTGSGKTSTLYAGLRRINKPELNVVTVEDPVEFDIPLINQVQVHERAGLTFANTLRALMRQNPDIIMVGEIRDSETAEIALRSALTGHQVLSTLHTNDAPGAITRLLDMDVPPYMVASALSGVLAQRLVRTLCSKCRTEAPSDDVSRVALSLSADDGPFYEATGCRHCENNGYTGQTGLFELMVANREIRQMIMNKATTEDLRGAALGAGMKSLKDEGLAKARRGITSLSEVTRVAQDWEQAGGE